MNVVAIEADTTVYAQTAADPGLASHVTATVRDEASAADALQLALRGENLLLHAVAPRLVLDRLYEDLRRVGTVVVRTGPLPISLTARLDPDERALLELISEGRGIADAARHLHLSLRTANRLRTAARRTLGVATTIEAVAIFSRSEPNRD